MRRFTHWLLLFDAWDRVGIVALCAAGLALAVAYVHGLAVAVVAALS